MGLFHKARGIAFENIASVTILEQTQLYKGQSNWGMSFGSTMGDGRVIAMNETVPAGAEVTFSITYKDGKQEIVKAKSGTDICTRLLQLALDPPRTVDGNPTEGDAQRPYQRVELQKNQLPNGKYIAGKDFPVGIYDFTWVFGSGTLMLFKDLSDTRTLGACLFSQWVGTNDYEQRQCINVHCDEGNVLVLQGNLIVQISRSKKVEIDL